MYIASAGEQGLYNLYFHNCQNYKYDSQVALDFTVRICFFLFFFVAIIIYWIWRCDKFTGTNIGN